LKRHLYSQSGDTLIEVVVSLAILAVTLVTSFDIANRSYSEGFQSREHTQAVFLAQEQVEKLYAFRNNLITAAIAANSSTPVMQPTPSNFGYCAAAAGCHFDPGSSTPSSGPAQPIIFGGITYHVVIGPLATPAINVTNDQGSFVATVSWSSSVGTGQTAANTGDTGTNENTTTLDAILVDNRGTIPRDCSVVGSSQCS